MDLIKEVIDWALLNWPEQLQEINQHISCAQDLEKTQKLAHTLKGATANIGANSMTILASEIENAQNFITMQQLIPQLLEQFDLLQNTINQNLNKGETL